MKSLLCLGCLLLCGCTTVQMPNGAKLSTPADIENVTLTADSFHADKITHSFFVKTFQQLATMFGLGAVLP